jgi:hypothetical protein
MVSRTEPLSVAIETHDGTIVASESLLARFLMRELESSDDINDLLALFAAPQQSVARRLAARVADNGDDALKPFVAQNRVHFEIRDDSWLSHADGGISATVNAREGAPKPGCCRSAEGFRDALYRHEYGLDHIGDHPLLGHVWSSL